MRWLTGNPTGLMSPEVPLDPTAGCRGLICHRGSPPTVCRQLGLEEELQAENAVSARSFFAYDRCVSVLRRSSPRTANAFQSSVPLSEYVRGLVHDHVLQKGDALRTRAVCLGYKQHSSLFPGLPTAIPNISRRLSQTVVEPSVQYRIPGRLFRLILSPTTRQARVVALPEGRPSEPLFQLSERIRNLLISVQ